MRCPNCGTINPPHAKFCLECGNRLVVCPNCGTINLPIAKFCIECGTRLAASAGGENTAPLPAVPAQESSQTQEIQAQVWPARSITNGNGWQESGLADGNRGRLTAPEERRVVTVMFADIIGSTPLADRLDPEDMRAILAGYFNLMAEQIRRHSGTVEKYIGDAVMAVFGAPVAHEDDPDRAIRAALDMQAALASFNATRQARDPEATRLQMRIGINTGEVAAPGAQFNRQDFLITGDAVNVAARLQQVAMPDTILVGERTYLTTRNVFEFKPLAPLTVKGKTQPLRAWVAQGFRWRSRTIMQHPRGIEGLQSPLVGRTLELTLMHATYARVQAEQHPHLITLLGDPGIGKTRLVQEFIGREEEAARCTTCEDTLREPIVLHGRCPPYGEGITYWPLVEILRALLNVQDGESGETLEKRFIEYIRETLSRAKRGEDADQVASALIRSIGRALSGDTASLPGTDRREIQRSAHSKSTEQGGPQAALLRAWRVLLESIAQEQPLILVIDDLQWADEALLDLLEYLTDRIADVPVLFICPARPDFLERRRDWGGGRRNFTTIVLDALSQEESGELITGLLDSYDLPEVLIHTIQNRAEGNPFFVEELVRMLIDQGVLVNENGAWRVSAQKGSVLSELASPATPPEDTLLDIHYVLPLRVPDTIQGVLAARVDLLRPVEKQVLQSASIIGRTFWLSGLLELTEGLDTDSVLQTLEELAERDFIEEAEKEGRSPIEHDRTFIFKHVLIRDVVYNNLPRIRRSQEHAQLAIWLEEQAGDNTETFAELLAYHYQQALVTWSATLLAQTMGPGEAGSRLPLTRQELARRAIHYLTLAGDQAYHSYYTIRAIQAYSEALDILLESDAGLLTIAHMHQKLGDAYTQRANADEAWHQYSHALKLMKEAPEVGRKGLLCLYLRMGELSTRWLGWFTTWLDAQEVRTYIDAGLALLEGQPPSGELSSFFTYQAMWYIRQVKYENGEKRIEMAEKALASGHEALRIAEEVGDTNALWIALDALGFIYQKQHKYMEAHATQHRRQDLQSLISWREELYDLYSSLGWAHENVSDYPSAAKWFGKAWRIAQTMESPSMLLYSLMGRMYVWYQWNRWPEVREVAQQILQMGEQYSLDEHRLLDALETLADIDYRTGNQEESDSKLRQYKRLVEQRGLQPKLSRGIYLAREEWEQARNDFKEALEQTEPFPSPAAVALLAELYVITGESADEQQAMCERAVALGEQSGARKFHAVALRARGRMHLEQQNWGAAERDLKEALSRFEILDLPWERGQALYCLGMLYRRHADLVSSDNPTERAADEGRARLYFEQALGFFESLKAVHDAERARVALEQGREATV